MDIRAVMCAVLPPPPITLIKSIPSAIISSVTTSFELMGC